MALVVEKLLTVFQTLPILFIVFSYSQCCEDTNGCALTTLSPSGVVRVCPQSQVNITCMTNESSFLYWTVSVPSLDTTPTEIISNQGAQSRPNLPVGSSVFHFTRISSDDESPLISQLNIDNVTVGINGTRLFCSTDGDTNNALITKIHVIENIINHPHPPKVNITSNLSSDSVTVNLDWTEEDGVSYNVSVTPPLMIRQVCSNCVELTVPYNIVYNVSVLSTLCGRNTAATVVELIYTKCAHPLATTAVNPSVPDISDYNDTLGSVVHFSCSSGLVLNGNRTATCMSNGEWFPDPREVMCVEASCGDLFNLSGSVDNLTQSIIAYSDQLNMINFSCPLGFALSGPSSTTCMSNGQWQPDPSRVECNEATRTKNSTNIVPDGFSTVTTVFLDASLQTSIGAIIAGISGSGALIVFTIIITAVFIYVAVRMNRKGLIHLRKKKQHNNIITQTGQTDENYLNQDIQSEYSLVQPHSRANQLQLISRHEENPDPQIQVVQGTLIYADLSTSINKQPKIKIMPLDFEENHIEYATINHKLHTVKPSCQEILQPTVDEVNLDTLLIQLREQVTPVWYQFGEKAGVEKEFLDDIASKCSPDDCIIEMFDRWLRTYDGKPTWRDVAQVLKTINLQQLALDIEQGHTTGQLPVRVDMDEIPEHVFTKATPQMTPSMLPPPIPPKNVESSTSNAQYMYKSDHDNKPPKLPRKIANEPTLPPLPPKPQGSMS